MAHVIRNGKRYRFAVPYSGMRYQIAHYMPIQDASGHVDGNEQILFIDDHETGIGMECDGEDAVELEKLIRAFDSGDLTHAQFEAELAAFIRVGYPS